jgi:hypothetical protein
MNQVYLLNPKLLNLKRLISTFDAPECNGAMVLLNCVEASLHLGWLAKVEMCFKVHVDAHDIQQSVENFVPYLNPIVVIDQFKM